MLLRGTGGENSKHNRCWSQVSKLISPGSLASRTRASESIFPTLPTHLLLRDWEQVISRNPSLAYRPEDQFLPTLSTHFPMGAWENRQGFFDIPVLPIDQRRDFPNTSHTFPHGTWKNQNNFSETSQSCLFTSESIFPHSSYTSQRELGRIDTFFREIPVLPIDHRRDSPNTPHTFPRESFGESTRSSEKSHSCPIDQRIDSPNTLHPFPHESFGESTRSSEKLQSCPIDQRRDSPNIPPTFPHESLGEVRTWLCWRFCWSLCWSSSSWRCFISFCCCSRSSACCCCWRSFSCCCRFSICCFCSSCCRLSASCCCSCCFRRISSSCILRASSCCFWSWEQ